LFDCLQLAKDLALKRGLHQSKWCEGTEKGKFPSWCVIGSQRCLSFLSSIDPFAHISSVLKINPIIFNQYILDYSLILVIAELCDRICCMGVLGCCCQSPHQQSRVSMSLVDWRIMMSTTDRKWSIHD
jgi:hypothetical protein